MGLRSGTSRRRWSALLALLFVLAQALVASGSVAADSAVPRSNELGIDFISAPGNPPLVSDWRLSQATAAGAGWDRWVMYWNQIETSPGQYDWSQVDPVVEADAARHLNIDAVLLGTPSFYQTAARAEIQSQSIDAPHGGLNRLTSSATTPPQGLDLPTFADGTDNWAPGKAINPQNHWAMFVFAAVSRYHNQIHDWEIWNEPDFNQFWDGSVEQYVRLLKVAYLAAHSADVSAQILVGGMMYWQWANAYGDQAWLKKFLGLIAADPQAAANGDYFDVIPWHWYSRSSDVYTKTLSAEQVLASYGMSGKEIWINETNAPACDESENVPGFQYANCNDYPGGTNPNGNWALGYATVNEQASFIIQAIAYAFAAGASHVFQFQFQDDGNVNAYGLFRNDGSARPEYEAYQLAARYLSGFATVRRYTGNGAEWISFGVPGQNAHRATVLWNDTGHPVSVTIPGLGGLATSVSLIQQDGSEQSLSPACSYTISLAPATDNRNFDNPWNPNDYIIGGPTVFLVETVQPDTTPPVSLATVAPNTSSQEPFTVSWSGSDPHGWGIFSYTIQDRDLSTHGYWTDWLTNTTKTSATFTPTPGHVYAFRSLAEDWAGNVETKLATQSDTTVQPTLAPAATTGQATTIYLPLVGNGGVSGC